MFFTRLGGVAVATFSDLVSTMLPVTWLHRSYGTGGVARDHGKKKFDWCFDFLYSLLYLEIKSRVTSVLLILDWLVTIAVRLKPGMHQCNWIWISKCKGHSWPSQGRSTPRINKKTATKLVYRP